MVCVNEFTAKLALDQPYAFVRSVVITSLRAKMNNRLAVWWVLVAKEVRSHESVFDL